MNGQYRTRMTRSLLIVNERSGSFDPALVEALEQRFVQAGSPLGRRLVLGKEDLPDAASATAQGLDLIVILTGDGTVSSAADALAGWDGTLLVLPGGTMNLLSHALHGALGAEAIVEAYLAGEGTALTVPMIRAGALTAYCGVIAGPTALWGDVREDLRNGDLASLGETVPRALNATLKAPGVRLEGEDEEEFPALYLEPWQDGIHAYGIQAAGAGDLLRHGLAWLKGDFREGPSRIVSVETDLGVLTGGERLELLVDGEREDAAAPLRARWAQSPVHFHSVRGAHRWR
jgi:hypothetical protein